MSIKVIARPACSGTRRLLGNRRALRAALAAFVVIAVLSLGACQVLAPVFEERVPGIAGLVAGIIAVLGFVVARMRR